MYKVALNQRDNIEICQIYAIEKKRWGTIWVRYLDEKKNKKISKNRENIDDLCCKINQFKLLQKLPTIVVKKEK
jgi:hypothetical protein